MLGFSSAHTFCHLLTFLNSCPNFSKSWHSPRNLTRAMVLEVVAQCKTWLKHCDVDPVFQSYLQISHSLVTSFQGISDLLSSWKSGGGGRGFLSGNVGINILRTSIAFRVLRALSESRATETSNPSGNWACPSSRVDPESFLCLQIAEEQCQQSARCCGATVHMQGGLCTTPLDRWVLQPCSWVCSRALDDLGSWTPTGRGATPNVTSFWE